MPHIFIMTTIPFLRSLISPSAYYNKDLWRLSNSLILYLVKLIPKYFFILFYRYKYPYCISALTEQDFDKLLLSLHLEFVSSAEHLFETIGFRWIKYLNLVFTWVLWVEEFFSIDFSRWIEGYFRIDMFWSVYFELLMLEWWFWWSELLMEV